MAAAAHNAGSGRPCRWRDGPAVDAAAWVEGIPFNETPRLRQESGQQLGGLRAAHATGPRHLAESPAGATIGPRAAQAAAANPDLP